MAFTPVSSFSAALLKPTIAATFIGTCLLTLNPARASVLVEPRVMRNGQSEPAAIAENSDDIVAIATSTDDFSTLSAALQAGNLGSILSGEGPFTVFAPTNTAFEALPAGTLDTLLLPANRDLLVKLLYNHVGYGDFGSSDLNTGSFETFDGTVAVNVAPNGVTVGGANVVQADVTATNGVIHAVDQVLLPVGFTEQLAARTVDSTSTASSSSGTTTTRTTTLQETAIDRAVAPTAPVAESVAPAAAEPVAPQPAPAAAQEPVRGLW
ncbi:MAG: fasciclin domain-containing protein [Phormidesmis sp.]